MSSARHGGGLSVPETLTKWVTGRVKLLWDYRGLFLSGGVLFGVSVFLPALSVSANAVPTCNSTMLCTNGATPWGVITSLFIYDGWQNAPAYFFILGSYVWFSDSVQQRVRFARANFVSILIFAAAIVANALWVIAKPLAYSWGPSGVVYALWGALFAFALADGLPHHPRSINPRTWYQNKENRDAAVGNLVLFASTAFVLVLDPPLFLSAGPGINAFAHAVSFLAGYFGAQAYYWTRSRN